MDGSPRKDHVERVIGEWQFLGNGDDEPQSLGDPVRPSRYCARRALRSIGLTSVASAAPARRNLTAAVPAPPS